MVKQRPATLKILDEVNCVFTGIHPTHIVELRDKFALHAPGYFFNPQYELGRWDGKIRYFHTTGKTFVHLLDKVLPAVTRLGYKLKIIDKRSSVGVFPPPIDKDYFSHIFKNGEPWEFREYQLDFVNTLLDNGNGVGIGGTGSGKTSMSAATALSYERAGNLRTVIIVPDKNLVSQTRKAFEFFELDVGQYGGGVKDLDHTHIVSTWQSLKNNPTVMHNFDVVLVDECHGLKAKKIQELLLDHGKTIQYRFGVTGTLPKEASDARAVHICVGPTRIEIPAHLLIEQGHLAKLNINVIEHRVDLKKEYADYLTSNPDPEDKLTYRQFKNSYYPDFTSERKALQNDKDRLEWKAAFLEESRDHYGNTLCLTVGVPYGKKLTKMIDGAVYLYGDDEIEVREQVYALFADQDDLIVIMNAKIGSVGLDIERIFHMVLDDIGKSFVQVIQGIGRGLRKAHDKDSVTVTDLCADLKYSRRHLRRRLKYYDEAKYPYKRHLVDYN